VRAVPLNSLSKRAPFRVAQAETEFLEGKENVAVKKISDDEFEIVFLREGKTKILIGTKYSLQKEIVEFEIQANGKEK